MEFKGKEEGDEEFSLEVEGGGMELEEEEEGEEGGALEFDSGFESDDEVRDGI